MKRWMLTVSQSSNLAETQEVYVGRKQSQAGHFGRGRRGCAQGLGMTTATFEENEDRRCSVASIRDTGQMNAPALRQAYGSPKA